MNGLTMKWPPAKRRSFIHSFSHSFIWLVSSRGKWKDNLSVSLSFFYSFSFLLYSLTLLPVIVQMGDFLVQPCIGSHERLKMSGTWLTLPLPPLPEHSWHWNCRCCCLHNNAKNWLGSLSKLFFLPEQKSISILHQHSIQLQECDLTLQLAS